MIYPEKIKILAKKNQPKPEEARYWVDLTADPYGGIWKVWNGLTWIRVFASSGSGGGIEEAPSDGNLYGRKNQVWQEIDIPDVSIYATKTELDQKADKDSVPDLSDYLTASDIAKYYQPKGNYLTEIPEGYLTITEADGRYALKDESGGEVDIDLSDYLTIANAESTYATKSEVQTVRESVQAEVDTKQDTLISGTNIKTINGASLLGSGNIALETPEEGLSDAASDGKLYGRKDGTWSEIVIPDTSELATKSELSSKLDIGTYNADKATFALKTEIPDTSTFITTETADGKYQPKGSYLTSVPAEYVTESELSQKGYATTEQIPDISTKQDTLVSGTNIKTINNQSILGQGNIEITTGTGGIADAPSDGTIYGRQNGNWVEVNVDTSDLATKEELLQKADAEDVASQISTEASSRAQEDNRLSNLIEDETEAREAAVTTLTSNKLDKSTYDSDKLTFALKSEIPTDYLTAEDLPDTSNFATKQEVQAKQDTLISGTNIKTINGASVLGEGNITIETPEGGIADAPSDDNTYARKNGAWTTITIPDTSDLATKTELSSYATLTGAQFTGTIGAPIVAVVDNSDGMRAAIQSSKNDILFRTYNAGIDSMTFQVQNSTPLKITEAGIWENNTLLESKYAKLTDLDDLALKAEIPSNVSELTNDAGYITNSSLTSYATQEYVNTQISNLVNSAPEALNTLDELAAALNDDSNFATTVTNQIAAKLDVTTYTNDKETFALKTELSSKADSSALANYVTTATAESTYAKKSEIPQQSLLPYDFFGTIDNYSTNSSITINADSKYLTVYNMQSEINTLDIRFVNSLYKGVEYLIIVISNNYTPTVRPIGYNGQDIQIIGSSNRFSMEKNQILEISAIRTDSAVICRVSSPSGYVGNDDLFG